MKPLNSAEYLGIVSLIYITGGLISICTGLNSTAFNSLTIIDILQLVWIGLLAAPLIIPMNKIVNINPLWK